MVLVLGCVEVCCCGCEVADVDLVVHAVVHVDVVVAPAWHGPIGAYDGVRSASGHSGCAAVGANHEGIKTAETVTSATTLPVNGATPFMASVKVLHPEGTVRFP